MVTTEFRSGPAADESGFLRIAGVLLAAGSIGIVAVSTCYGLAGPEATLPGASAGVESARAATASGAQWMRMAGLFGLPSDVLFAAGAAMLAATRRGPGAGIAVAGWLLLAIAGVLFTIVDAMVGFVLPHAAAMPQGEAAYAAVRALFDALFAAGTWTVGAGALAVAWSSHWAEYRRRTTLWLMRAAGVACLASGSGWMLGLPTGPLAGPAIALSVVALLLLAWSAITDAGRSQGDGPRVAMKLP
jgi:hypothetical protein